MSPTEQQSPAIGIIGGSGLYEIDGLDDCRRLEMDTPFGSPSDAFMTGVLHQRRVVFLPRHGVGHRLLPHEINHKANIWAMRALGVRWLISVTAVGSLREHLAPRDLVVPDQLIDRTGSASRHTFFGDGIAAHVGFADPYCPELRRCLLSAAVAFAPKVHAQGTYLCMNGPAFSTRAEAAMHRMIGADIIGMTNAPEARLCREAEISAATLALVTDDDCWKTDEEPVDVETVIGHMQANAALARKIVADVVARIPQEPNFPSHRALEHAIFTPREAWPSATAARLAPILKLETPQP